MKKLFVLSTIALLGASIPLSINASKAYKAEEGELLSSEVFSLEESSYQSLSDSLIIDEVEESKEDPVQDVIDAMEEKINQLQQTKTYALVSAIVTVVYSVWGILDKIISRAKTKEIAFNSSTIAEFGEEIKKQADKIAELEKALSEKQDITNGSLVANKEELEQAIIAFTNSIDSIESLREGQERIVKALLEICKCDDELVKSGAFSKIVEMLSGATKDE